MSGHSKWNNIKRKKEKTDAQKAKIFTKIGREITVAVKEGGADPNNNGKLRDLIAKAKSNNVPNDNIERIIKKAGSSDKADYESIVYEGYGPNGVAVIVETLTDNRNRTASDVRHYFGVIVMENTFTDEEKLMEDIMESGADDYNIDEEEVEIVTSPADFQAVRDNLTEMGYTFVSAEVEMVPSNYVTLTDPDHILKMNLLLEHLEDNDDVQNVYHNWDMPEEEDED